jgi:hypothetical protein
MLVRQSTFIADKFEWLAEVIIRQTKRQPADGTLMPGSFIIQKSLPLADP